MNLATPIWRFVGMNVYRRAFCMSILLGVAVCG
jgi:hypothetical protein